MIRLPSSLIQVPPSLKVITFCGGVAGVLKIETADRSHRQGGCRLSPTDVDSSRAFASCLPNVCSAWRYEKCLGGMKSEVRPGE
jgi:hypothetical protein